MKEMTQYTDVKNNTKIQQHSMTKTDVNDLYNLHVKFQQSKNNLCDAMDYVNGNSEHISYQDMEIVKALDDLRDTFEVMSKEMDNIESEFNEKFSFAIKERKRPNTFFISLAIISFAISYYRSTVCYYIISISFRSPLRLALQI